MAEKDISDLEKEINNLIRDLKKTSENNEYPTIIDAFCVNVPDTLYINISIIRGDAEKAGIEMPRELDYYAALAYGNMVRGTLYNQMGLVPIGLDKDGKPERIRQTEDFSMEDYMGAFVHDPEDLIEDLLKVVDEGVEFMSPHLYQYGKRIGYTADELDALMERVPKVFPDDINDTFNRFRQAFEKVHSAEGEAKKELFADAYILGETFMYHALHVYNIFIQQEKSKQ